MYKPILVALITAAGFTGCRWDKSAEAACFKTPDKRGSSITSPTPGARWLSSPLGTVALATFRRRLS